MKKVLSLIQPTGELHIGNYFGAIQNWVNIQDQFKCFFGVADYHTMTMPYEAEQLRQNIWNMVYRVLACGVKPENLFIQSQVPEHTELCWILSCFCSYGELTRMTQFKDKSTQSKEIAKDTFVSAGLMLYPVLQAADILMYHADYVPIGKDQVQHLELSRNIADRFNHQFNKPYFTAPEPLFTDFPKILSLANPEKKMSKSLGEKHYIPLFADEKQITKQVKSAVTDSGDTTAQSMSPGVKNLLELLKASGHQEAYDHYFKLWESGQIQYGPLKNDVANALIELTSGFRAKLNEILDQKEFYQEQVIQNSQKIRKAAQNTITEVREIVGLTVLAY